jgi:predicted SAM-dependent methyltransferase
MRQGVEVHCGTLDDAPWPPESFDAILFNHSLEHIPDPGDALARAYRLLRPNGTVAIAVPNFGSWQRRLFGGSWFQLDVPRHLQHFERRTLVGLLQSSDLQVVEVDTSDMRIAFLASLQYALFDRLVLSGRPLWLLSSVLQPLLALARRVADGDILTVVATKG